MPELASDPNMGCTGKKRDIDRHRGHHIEGFVRSSETWRVEFEVYDGKGLDAYEDGN